jgi:hypothetical protein
MTPPTKRLNLSRLRPKPLQAETSYREFHSINSGSRARQQRRTIKHANLLPLGFLFLLSLPATGARGTNTALVVASEGTDAALDRAAGAPAFL